MELRDVGKDMLPALAQNSPGVLFPVLHGIVGEDATMKKVLELAGVRTSVPAHACRNGRSSGPGGWLMLHRRLARGSITG